jgi:hypothetical protein
MRLTFKFDLALSGVYLMKLQYEKLMNQKPTAVS